LPGQEIVGHAVNSDQQQIEVGVHRGPLGSAVGIEHRRLRLLRYVPFPGPTTTPTAVALLI
ncbi:MAG TPA: hypothetical protein VK538_07765, partial [Solirubrobacteraceae bacterium]|nr:hypothetical protein [Solirubrobacteraceae bacterium]